MKAMGNGHLAHFAALKILPKDMFFLLFDPSVTFQETTFVAVKDVRAKIL